MVLVMAMAVTWLPIWGSTTKDGIVDSGQCGNNVFWELDDEGVLRIFGTGMMYGYGRTYNWLSGRWEVNAPDYIRYYADQIETAIIDSGVTGISGAFQDCRNLTGVTISDTVASIGDWAFFNSGLLSITIPDSVAYIGSNAFASCNGLTGIIIPDSVKAMGGSVFSNCQNLRSAALPQTISEIPPSTFQSCRALAGIDIPRDVTAIGYGAFQGCSSLTEIYIPEDVIEIGSSAFSGCTALRTINLPDGLTLINSFLLYNCSALTNISIPTGVISIGDSAFSYCRTLTEIVVPDSVKTIGSQAFSYCDMLRAITLPRDLTTISDELFYYCGSLTGLAIPSGVASIGDKSFSYCRTLAGIVIPDSVKTIGNQAFSYCDLLKTVTLPCDLTAISDGLFNACSSLMPFIVPDGVTSIGSNSFNGCRALTEIILPDGLQSIGYSAFSNSGLIEITLPDSVDELGNNMFQGCISLERAVLPQGIQKINDYMFSGCSALVGYTIPDSVMSIGNYAFSSSGLIEITIPVGVSELGNGIFQGCTNLEYAALPYGLQRISDYLFSGCSSLTEYTIPDSVTSIGNYAFSNTGLIEITVPDGLTGLGSGVFSECRSLERVTLPDTLQTIGYYLFNNCTKLSEITIPNSVTSIGYYAFFGCVSLYDLTIPIEVNAIDATTFWASYATILPDIILRVTPDSYAEEYAIMYGISYVYSTAGEMLILILPPNAQALYDDLTLSLRNLTTGQMTTLSVTGGLIYRLGVSPGRRYAAMLYNKYGSVVSMIEEFTASGSDTLDFPTLAPPRMAAVAVKDDAGNTITSQTWITWSDMDGKFLKQGDVLTQLADGFNLQAQITLNDVLGARFHNPEPLLHTVSGDQTVTVTLRPFTTVTLRGRVEDNSTNLPISGAAVSVSQTLNGQFPKITTATTDEDGEFTVQIYDTAYTLAVSKPEYINAVLEKTPPSGDADVGVISLLPIDGATVLTLELNYSPSVFEGDMTESRLLWERGNDIVFSLYNVTKNTPIQDISVFFPQIVLPDGAAANDIIRVTVSSRRDDFAAVSVYATLGDNLRADVVFNLIQNGGVSAILTHGPEECEAILYNSSGKLVNTRPYTNGSVISNPLPAGDYTLVSMSSSYLFNSLQNLSDLSSVGLEENRDYSSINVTVIPGVIKTILTGNVPEFNETALTYLSEGSFTVNKSSSKAGQPLLLRAQFNLKEPYHSSADSVRLIVELPEGCDFVNDSLLEGSNPANYSLDGRTLTVFLQEYQDIIRFFVLPPNDGDFAVGAFAEFTMSGRTLLQPIGVAYCTVRSLDLGAPNVTARATIPVYGAAPAGSLVTIYDNDVTVAQTTALTNGSWQCEVNLYQPDQSLYHDIYAKVLTASGAALLSPTHTVMYNPNAILPAKVTMYNYNTVVFDFLALANRTSYTYVPSYTTFTFAVEFTVNDPGHIKDVVLNVHMSDKTVDHLPCTYVEGKSVWAATYEADGRYRLPVNVSVDFRTEFISPISASFTGRSGPDVAGDNYVYTPPVPPVITGGETFAVNELSPARGSNGQVTMRITGSKLDVDLKAALTRGDNIISAKYIYYMDETTAYATYDMAGMSDGVYGLSVKQDGQTASLSNCFTLDSALPHGKLVTDISMASVIKTDTVYTGTITYRNEGYTDVDAPTYCLEGNNLLTAEPNSDMFYSKCAFWASNAEGLGSILAHGESGGITFCYKALRNDSFGLYVSAMLDNDDRIRETVCFGYSDYHCGELDDEESEGAMSLSMLRAARSSTNNTLGCPHGACACPCGIDESPFSPFFPWIEWLPLMIDTSAYGADRYGKNGYYGHKGIDYMGGGIKVGTPVLAIADGEVIRIHTQFTDPPSAGFPNSRQTGAVSVRLSDGTVVTYGEINPSIYKGAKIKKGTILGFVMQANVGKDEFGNDKYPPMLHLEVKVNGKHIDPTDWLRSLDSKVCQCVCSACKPPPPPPEKDPIIDPSGFVYEAVESNRLEGVTATIFYRQSGAPAFWDATDYEQVNPLPTDVNGMYAWDVPFGDWQVKYEKDGFQTSYSDWLPVPPPQFDINIGMVSYATPEVTYINAYSDGVEIMFSKYMIASDLTAQKITLSSGGSARAITVAPDIEAAPDGTALARSIWLYPVDGSLSGRVTISVDASIRSYSDVPLGAAFSREYQVVPRPQSIEVQGIQLACGQTETLTVQVVPQGAAIGKTLYAHSAMGSIVSVTPSVDLAGDGTAVFTVTGQLPGASEIVFSLEDSQLTQNVTVHVAMPGETEWEKNELSVATDKAALTWASICGENIEQDHVIYDLAILPASGGNGTTIKWTSANPAVSNTGVVTRPTFGEGNATGTLTAEISKGEASDTVSFELVVLELPITDEQSVAVDKAALTWESICGENTAQDQVIYDLSELPAAGENGTTITWMSTNPAVSDTGEVIRPAYGDGDATGALTAEISKGEATDTVTFEIAVKQLLISDEQAVAADKAALTWENIRSDNIMKDQVIYDLVALPISGVNGTTIIWASTNPAVSNTGTVIRPTFGEGDATGMLTAEISRGETTDTVTFELVVLELPITDAQAVAAVKADLLWESICGENADQDQVIYDLAGLPTAGENGTTITWTSTNPAVSDTGDVIRPAYGEGDATGTLTAEIRRGETTDTVTFELVVLELPISDEQAVAADKAALTWASIRGDNIEQDQVIYDLEQLPTAGQNGTTITWTSTNSAISDIGAVTRPSFGTGDATGVLTAEISRGETTDTVTFELVVLELPITDAQAVAADKAVLTWASICGENAGLNQVIYDLAELPAAGENGTTITWVSANPAVSDTGLVTRPAYGAGNATGVLTAIVSRGDMSSTADFDLTVIASDVAPTYNLSVSLGTGGTVSGTQEGDYTEGAVVSVTASANSGYSFFGWTATGIILESPSSRTIAFNMPTNNVELTANFTQRGAGTTGAMRPPSEEIVPYKEEVVPDPETPLTGGWSNPYADVANTAWFFEAVRFVTERGLMKGTSADKFSPDVFMSRAMLVTVLYRLEGEPSVSGDISFSDVESGEWYSDAILWASQNEIVKGYNNDTFGLNDPVTREQVVTILYRYAKAKGLDVSASADMSIFTDAASVSDWALDAIKWAVSVGIIQGRTATTIVPRETSTRAEVATIFKRYIEDFLGIADEPEE